MKKIFAVAALSATLLSSSAVWAADCTTEVAKDDLSQDQIQALYDCLKSELRAGYASKDGALTKEYQEWKAVSKSPAAPGTHGKRFLITYANDAAFDEYVKYSDERGPMPVGSILAKESFSLSKKGKARKGPLFFMTKLAAGEAAKFGDWLYGAFKPNGKVMKVKQSFCHGCHKAFEDQDSLGYPDEDVRFPVN